MSARSTRWAVLWSLAAATLVGGAVAADFAGRLGLGFVLLLAAIAFVVAAQWRAHDRFAGLLRRTLTQSLRTAARCPSCGGENVERWISVSWWSERCLGCGYFNEIQH